jgi:hypothetical protein
MLPLVLLFAAIWYHSNTMKHNYVVELFFLHNKETLPPHVFSFPCFLEFICFMCHVFFSLDNVSYGWCRGMHNVEWWICLLDREVFLCVGINHKNYDLKCLGVTT